MDSWGGRRGPLRWAMSPCRASCRDGLQWNILHLLREEERDE